MPHVIVKLYPGRTDQQKEMLSKRIVQDILEVFRCREASVSIAFEEVPEEIWKLEVYEPDIKAKCDTLAKKPGYSM
jgi:4-oxalocrotonate tautomerase